MLSNWSLSVGSPSELETLTGRFKSKATDFMMLFLAHTLVLTNPDHSHY
jgi:hypothetical protein